MRDRNCRAELRMAAGFIRSGISAYVRRLERRSAAIPRTLSQWIVVAATGWALFFLLASTLRMLFQASPVHNLGDLLPMAVPYVLVAVAPLAGYLLAASAFPSGVLTAQPQIRLSLYGKWRRLSILDARANPLFGPAGFMASLLIGLLLNVVVRSFEFLAAVPALNHHAPAWGQSLFLLMAVDVVVMSFFYMVCFVMALRTVPLFPRMLLFAWTLDVVAQMIIAEQIGAMADLPGQVAQPLRSLLEGNVTKVLISACVWLPYLILSERVNVTYRQRASA